MSHIAANLDMCPWPEAAARLRSEVERVWAEEGGHAPGRILRASVLMERVSPLDWLSDISGELRFYGSTRDRNMALEIGGVGVADEAVWHEPVAYEAVFKRLHATLDTSSNGLRYYGGFRFDAHSEPDDDWRSFGVSRFVIPRLELRTGPMGSQLSFHFKPDEAASGALTPFMDRLADMSFAERTWEDTFPPPRSRSDTPDEAGWTANVEVALQDFDAGSLEKIVLARKALFEFEGHLDPVTLLHRLKSATPECFHFCYMPSEAIAFVGASPERLYRREQREIETEAVAGTRMRSKDDAEDERLGAELLASDKDQREHAFVTNGIRDALAPLCEALDIKDQPSLLKLARGQHLYTPVKGTLREEAGDAAILGALHPTPALGGSPTDRALARISELEPFDRGWYAAPVGWVSRDSAEFAVAIRSGLVQPQRLALFSGAGIVKGSTPESEWEEIELKIRDFIKVLTGS